MVGRIRIDPVGGADAGAVELAAAVSRYVPGFVVQLECRYPAVLTAIAATAKTGSGVSAAYRSGDVVLCMLPGEDVSERCQVAIFLADVADARPAYPVVATVRDVAGLAAALAGAPPPVADELVTSAVPVTLAVG